MPIIKSYLLPHSPLLIPEIGKANHEILQKTNLVYKKIAQELEAQAIEVVLVISQHGPAQDEHLVINCAPEMNLSFPEFGFIPKQTTVSGAIQLSDLIFNQLKPKHPLHFLNQAELDYGSGIPIYLLKSQTAKFLASSIIPANNLSLEAHYSFGKDLAPVLAGSEKRIALIASGDLSHRLLPKSPGGYSWRGAKFDNKFIEHLQNPSLAVENLLKLDPKLIKESCQCALKPTLILLGALSELEWQTESLAYQTDFGIGYLSLEFIF